MSTVIGQPVSTWSENNLAPLEEAVKLRTYIERIREEERLRRLSFEEQEAIQKLAFEENTERVKAATRDTYTWVTEHTETFNEHWVVEGRPTPYEPFPRYPYFKALFEILAAERIHWFEKSRDMMISWGCTAFLTLNCMTMPECGGLIQCQKEDKSIQLIDYAKCLYDRQPAWLKDAFPLWKPLDQQPSLGLYFKHGGRLEGIPGGAHQIRSYHPWGYLNDESSFQPDAGDCYNEALSAIKGSIVFNSSAGPGWYADARRGIETAL